MPGSWAEQLQALNRQPFRPFTVFLSDGRKLETTVAGQVQMSDAELPFFEYVVKHNAHEEMVEFVSVAAVVGIRFVRSRLK